MTIPRRGSPVRGSKSGRPLMVALDLLGRRWALRVIWELREGPLSFRGLRARCDDVSPTSLNTRLAELKAAGIVEVTEAGYALSKSGVALLAALEPLDGWAKRWVR
ncbi:MAG: helix-turn-helix transcriptional regulator [Myxococcales bacterium]|nr:helix-turn-helix transcriptional regulator [Myxococcales bacterium]